MNNQPYVYKITHLPTKQWYVGSRYSEKAHINDGYMSSSKFIRSQYSQAPHEWIKEIIHLGTAQEVLEFETEILNLFDAKNDPKSFNQHNNTFGVKNRGGWNKGIKATKPAWNKGLTGLPGRKKTEEEKQRISAAHKGIPKKPESIERQKETLRLKFENGYRTASFGKTASDETRKKIGEASKGRKQPNVECPHCGKIGGKSGMITRHFNNCKLKDNAK